MTTKKIKMLKAINISKQYRGCTAVRNISLQVQQGEILGLLGPNGAGKTTCFYMLVGLISCDQGNILLDDEPITRLPVHLRARAGISYLPQEASIFRGLTVAENIMAILELRRDLSRRDRQQKLESLLEELQIGPIRHAMGISLSGGERRRTEIARALAMEPGFILLDEPFAGIDPIAVMEVKKIISDLARRGIGVLITDHNVRDTLAICTRACIVNQGAVLHEGVPQEILASQMVRDIYLGEHFSL